MSTIETFKMQAKRLCGHLSRQNMPITHSQSLEAVTAMHGHRDWNTALAAMSRAPVISTPLLLEVTRDSSPEYLNTSLQALLRLASVAIRFQMAPDLRVELAREAHIMVDQVERAGITALRSSGAVGAVDDNSIGK